MNLQQWIGREETTQDRIDARQARLMRSIVGSDDVFEEGAALPHLWNWLYFPPAAPLDQIGRDGHPMRGGFLPPVKLPRRMWAGGRVEFRGGLRIGDEASKTSRIASITEKEGATGPLCFVVVEHVFSVGGEIRLCEEQDIVYRSSALRKAAASVVPPAPGDPETTKIVQPSPVMLFRYSALTFNGHRIHYDRDYCRNVEGYEGLVVHGPLVATLLCDLARRHAGREPIGFTYRAVSPLFDTGPFTLSARIDANVVDLWAANPSGGLAMQAAAKLGIGG